VPGAAASFRVFGAQQFVGSPLGFAVVGDARLTVLMSGPDGRQWRRTDLPVPPGARGSVDQVARAGDGFLAVGTVEGRSAAWRWAGAGWLSLPIVATDSVSSIVTDDERIIVTGMKEIPDPVRPDLTTLAALAWESTDGGITWGTAGLALDGIGDIRVLAMDGGFVAVLAPPSSEKPLSAWRSTRPGTWEPVTLGGTGGGFDRPLISAMAVSGRRVVLAGNTVGTGGGGDRVIVWVGETTAP
jgi:hypothetical protein